jgi:hypothetical protein
VSEGGVLELYSGLRAGILLQWGFRWAWCVENELGVLGPRFRELFFIHVISFAGCSKKNLLVLVGEAEGT